MKKPYIITKFNSIDVLDFLEAKSKFDKPLAFLEIININGDWASNAPSFDLSKSLEFVLIDDTLICDVETALTNYGLNITITDVTEALLFGRIDLTNAPEDIKKEINDFYFNIFNNDDILDKICKIGIESLTELDKSILNKKS